MENYRQMVLDAQEKTKNAEVDAQEREQYRAGLRAVLQRSADARARRVVEDKARVAANKAHEAEMAAMDSEHAVKIKALKKQLEEANQHLAAAVQSQSESDRCHWHCQVHGLIRDLELAQQH